MIGSRSCPASLAPLLLHLRYVWSRQDEVRRYPSWLASRSAAFVFAFQPVSRVRYPTLGQLFDAWAAGRLHAPCPACGAPARVARVVQSFGGGAWAGLCTACDAVPERVPFEGMRLLSEAGVVVPRRLGDPVVVAPELSAPWAACVTDFDPSVEVVYAALGGAPRHVCIEAYAGGRWFYEPLNREMLDDANRPLLVHDGATWRTPDGRPVARREGARLEVFDGATPRPWLERVRLDGRPVHVEVGVTYLPVRYHQEEGDLLRWKDQPCLRTNGPVPVDVLLLVADGRVPPRASATPAPGGEPWA